MAAESETTGFWDKEAEYDTLISPLMVQIISLCKEHNIPLVAQFQFCDKEGEGPGYVTTSLPLKGFASERMIELAHAVKPQRPVALMETTVTEPDGSKRITIRRV